MKHNYKSKYKNVLLRPLSEQDIELLRNWRNNSDNTMYLKKIPFITAQMQKEWYLRYLNNDDEVCLAIEEINELHRVVGSLTLHDFANESCMLGHVLIGDKEAHGKKIGVNASIAATQLAFNEMGLKSVRLHVFSENVAACRVYQQAGFFITDTHEGSDGREEYTMIKEGNNKMNNMNKVQMLEFQQRGDERGHLVIVEGMQDIPFEIKRVFYIYGSAADVVRGQHANRESEFVLINVAGTSKVKVKDGKGNEVIYCLNRPHMGIYLPTMVWKDMYDFSADSVLLVLASTHYNAGEYIRDYDEFVKEINK